MTEDNANLATLSRQLGNETLQLFARNPYFTGSRPTAIKILKDISVVCAEFGFLHRVTTWGETSQKRLCVFGILPISFGGAQQIRLQQQEARQQQQQQQQQQTQASSSTNAAAAAAGTTTTATTTNTSSAVAEQNNNNNNNNNDNGNGGGSNNGSTVSSPASPAAAGAGATTITTATATASSSSSSSPPTATLTTAQQQRITQGAAASVANILAPPSVLTIGVPVQAWCTVNYPCEPPQLYIVPTPEYGERLVANHPIVDRTGQCYAPLLANWNPSESSLLSLLKQLQRIFGVIPPIWVDDRSGGGGGSSSSSSSPQAGGGAASAAAGNTNSSTQQASGSVFGEHVVVHDSSAADGGGGGNNNNGTGEEVTDEASICVVCLCEDREVVLIPCGHYCLCSSCAASVQTCPLCRGAIRLRQRVFV